MVLRFSPADWIIVSSYLLLVSFLAWYRRGKPGDDGEQFILGGRLLTLPAFIASLVSTWYGGILGVGEFSFRFGISNWLVFGAPYYVFAMIFAFYLAPKVRERGIYSIPHTIRGAYDTKTGLLSALLSFFITSPAPYVLMLAVLLQMVAGLEFLPALMICTILSGAYVLLGGFRSLVQTEKLQFLLMFGGFMMMIGILLRDQGISPIAADRLPPGHWLATGGNSWQYILVWFFIALWTIVAPTFHQFTAAARDAKTARNGILLSVLCWALFDAMTTFTGMYARGLMPELNNAVMAYPALAELVLPPIAKGIFYVAMLATVMSTVDGFTFISSVIVGHDMIRVVTRRNDDRILKKYVRIGVVITLLVSLFSILLFPSVINLWYVVGTIFIPGLLLPLLTVYWPRWRISHGSTFAAMLSGWLVSMGCFIYGHLHVEGGIPAYPLGLEPMYPGLFITLLIYTVGNLTKRMTEHTMEYS